MPLIDLVLFCVRALGAGVNRLLTGQAYKCQLCGWVPQDARWRDDAENEFLKCGFLRLLFGFCLQLSGFENKKPNDCAVMRCLDFYRRFSASGIMKNPFLSRVSHKEMCDAEKLSAIKDSVYSAADVIGQIVFAIKKQILD